MNGFNGKTGVQRLVSLVVSLFLTCIMVGELEAAWQILVTQEKSGEVSILDGDGGKVTATFRVGKRPRGICISPDSKIAYVALSGTPISAPPQLDAKGNPIFKKGKEDDDDDDAKKSDKSADGIGVIDIAQRKVLRKIKVGSDPEQLALSKDGTLMFVSNEDVGTASVVEIATGKVRQIIPVSREPEGVGTSPDGRFFYVTCETEGEIYAIDASSYKVINHFNVGGRPRSVDFLPDGTRGFIPSESAGQIHLIDTTEHRLLKTVQLPTPSRPMCVKVAGDGKKVYVSTGRAGTVCALDPENLKVENVIKVGARPWGIAISPDGKTLYSANGPSDDVSVVDLTTAKELRRIKTGGSPWGVALVPSPAGK
jgi:YVTN family beta-propeller protein